MYQQTIFGIIGESIRIKCRFTMGMIGKEGLSPTAQVRKADCSGILIVPVIHEDGNGWYYFDFTPDEEGIFPWSVSAGGLVIVDWAEIYGTVVTNMSFVPPTTAQIWAYGTRTLTSFGNFVSEIWSYATRTLTSIWNPLILRIISPGTALIIGGKSVKSLSIYQCEDITKTSQIIDDNGDGVDLTNYMTLHDGTLKMIARKTSDADSVALILEKDVTINIAEQGMITLILTHLETTMANGDYDLEIYGTATGGIIRVFAKVILRVQKSIHTRPI